MKISVNNDYNPSADQKPKPKLLFIRYIISMLPPLTKRQKEILDYIHDSVKKNGYAPSLQEIKDHFKLKAVSTVHEHLENLKNKGYIKKEMNQARGIQIQKNYNAKEYKKIKVVGHILKEQVIREDSQKKQICLDNSFLVKGTKYFALIVKDKSLSSFGINQNDTVVVCEDAEKSTKLFLAKDKNKTIVSENKNELLENCICSIVRSF